MVETTSLKIFTMLLILVCVPSPVAGVDVCGWVNNLLGCTTKCPLHVTNMTQEVYTLQSSLNATQVQARQLKLSLDLCRDTLASEQRASEKRANDYAAEMSLQDMLENKTAELEALRKEVHNLRRSHNTLNEHLQSSDFVTQTYRKSLEHNSQQLHSSKQEVRFYQAELQRLYDVLYSLGVFLIVASCFIYPRGPVPKTDGHGNTGADERQRMNLDFTVVEEATDTEGEARNEVKGAPEEKDNDEETNEVIIDIGPSTETITIIEIPFVPSDLEEKLTVEEAKEVDHVPETFSTSGTHFVFTNSEELNMEEMKGEDVKGVEPVTATISRAKTPFALDEAKEEEATRTRRHVTDLDRFNAEYYFNFTRNKKKKKTNATTNTNTNANANTNTNTTTAAKANDTCGTPRKAQDAKAKAEAKAVAEVIAQMKEAEEERLNRFNFSTQSTPTITRSPTRPRRNAPSLLILLDRLDNKQIYEKATF